MIIYQEALPYDNVGVSLQGLSKHLMAQHMQRDTQLKIYIEDGMLIMKITKLLLKNGR